MLVVLFWNYLSVLYYCPQFNFFFCVVMNDTVFNTLSFFVEFIFGNSFYL